MQHGCWACWALRMEPTNLCSPPDLPPAPPPCLPGSECHKLEEVFGHLPVWLAAENGVYVKPPHRYDTRTKIWDSSKPGQWRCLYEK